MTQLEAQQNTKATGFTNLLQVPSNTPIIQNSDIKNSEDPIQGNGDSWLKSMVHDDLSTKIHKWAVGVIETGIWPKPQMLAGSITDVTSVVQMEIDRIKREKIIDTDEKQDEMMQVAQQLTNGSKYQAVVQWSPYSKSSASPTNNKASADMEDDMLAQIGLGVGGNGDDGDDGGNEESGNNTCTNEGPGNPVIIKEGNLSWSIHVT